jgi:hypothetical protein
MHSVHASRLGELRQSEFLQSELDLIQPRNRVLPIFRVLELDHSLQVRPAIWPTQVGGEFGRVESALGEAGEM